MTKTNKLGLLAWNRTLTQVTVYALLVGAYGALAVIKENSQYKDVGDTPSDVHAGLTLVLGALLVFRTNSAYSRWWEARTLWGGLVNCCRNLSVKVSRLVELPADARNDFRKLIGAFPYVLMDHLRGDSSLERIQGLIEHHAALHHVPSALVAKLYADVGRLKREGRIDGDELRVLDIELRSLLDICGGCERIRNTRIVRSYRIFSRQCVLLYLATFPWGIVQDFRAWTIPLTAISAYFMIGMETVAEHIEDPFGDDEDDLDLDALCSTIERSVTEIFQRGPV